MRHNDYLRHLHIFYKTNGFLKNVSNVLDTKKGRYVIEKRLNLHIVVG